MRFSASALSLVWLVSLAGLPFNTQAAAGCADQYWQGQAPKLTNPALGQKTRELCFDGFTLQHSGVTRTPLWVGEYLTKQRLSKARGLDRQDSFHEEEQLPESERATMADYARSGYDRGHMAPNGDMGTRSQQADSFSLANMVPQSPTNNREVWRNLEEATRALVMQEGEAYVLTGPAFLGKTIRKTKRVFVPSHVYKVVYFPKRQAVGAYWAPNDESGTVEVVSLADVEKNIGINLLPSLSPAVKSRVVNLPTSMSQVKKNMLGKPLPNSAPDESPAMPTERSVKPVPNEPQDSSNWLLLLQHLIQIMFK